MCTCLPVLTFKIFHDICLHWHIAGQTSKFYPKYLDHPSIVLFCSLTQRNFHSCAVTMSSLATKPSKDAQFTKPLCFCVCKYISVTAPLLHTRAQKLLNFSIHWNQNFKDIKFQQIIWNCVFLIRMSTDEKFAVWAHFLWNIRKSSGKVSVKAHISIKNMTETLVSNRMEHFPAEEDIATVFSRTLPQRKLNNCINDLPITFSKIINIFLKFFVACGQLWYFR